MFFFFLLKECVQFFFDMWPVTGDMWQLTCDTWHMTHNVGWTFSQNLSSLALPVRDWQRLEDIRTKGSVNQLMNELMKSLADGWDCIISDYGISIIRSVYGSFNICSTYESCIISSAYGSSLISLAYRSFVKSSAYGGVPKITTIQHKSASQRHVAKDAVF